MNYWLIIRLPILFAIGVSEAVGAGGPGVVLCRGAGGAWAS